MGRVKVGFGKIYVMAGHPDGIELRAHYNGIFEFRDIITKKTIILRPEQLGMLHEKGGTNYHVIGKNNG